VELLRQLWLDGKSASQISAQLGHGLTRNAVIGKVHRLGLAGRAKAPSSASAPPRAASAPRMASRPSGGGARPQVRGATALALAVEPMFEARPVYQEEDVVVPMSLRVTIVELKEAMCRWPLGDPTSSDFRYCGSPSTSGPYCAHHGKLAYQPVQDRRRERERERRTALTR
jgi:GcrA cell cycle regulator